MGDHMDIDDLFETFHEAFRLECLPEYRVDSEATAIAEFVATGSIPKNLNEDWIELIKTSVEHSKSIKRLRLISKELTDYEKFELAAYRLNVEAGEEIRFAYRDDFKVPQDFWIFDMTWIAYLEYDQDGRFLGISTKLATSEEVEMAAFWKAVFDKSPSLGE